MIGHLSVSYTSYQKHLVAAQAGTDQTTDSFLTLDDFLAQKSYYFSTFTASMDIFDLIYAENSQNCVLHFNVSSRWMVVCL